MKKILNSLIAIEAGFILVSYFSELKWTALVPAIVYVSLAIADSIAKDRRFSVLVVMLSIAIAIPRIFIKYSELIQLSGSKNSESVEKTVIPPEYIPALQNCQLIPSWDSNGIKTCENSNKIENQKKQERLDKIFLLQSKIQKKTSEIRAKTELSITDVGMLILFIVLSISIPSGIFFLMHPAENEDSRFVKSLSGLDDMEKVRLLMDRGWEWRQSARTDRVIEDHIKISRATYYRRLRKSEKKSRNNLVVLKREASL